MLDFEFLEKGFGIVSAPSFECDFSWKIFLMLCSINWPNFIAKLSFLLQILVNMCVEIVCFSYQVVIQYHQKIETNI